MCGVCAVSSLSRTCTYCGTDGWQRCVAVSSGQLSGCWIVITATSPSTTRLCSTCPSPSCPRRWRASRFTPWTVNIASSRLWRLSPNPQLSVCSRLSLSLSTSEPLSYILRLKQLKVNSIYFLYMLPYFFCYISKIISMQSAHFLPVLVLPCRKHHQQLHRPVQSHDSSRRPEEGQLPQRVLLWGGRDGPQDPQTQGQVRHIFLSDKYPVWSDSWDSVWCMIDGATNKQSFSSPAGSIYSGHTETWVGNMAECYRTWYCSSVNKKINKF